ncbi:MAG TPA: FAD-binding oxidoreductase [Solirubrobacteraceae bacterium]
MNTRREKHWGWGYEDQQPTAQELVAQAQAIAQHLGFGEVELESPVAIEQVKLPPPRVSAGPALDSLSLTDTHSRASHAWGKSYCDVVRAFRGRFDHPPDFVARPRDESELERVLEWCSARRVAAIPYGGGTSVVGGVRPQVDPSFEGAISVDLRSLEGVLEVDDTSRCALIQAGTCGPALERQLAEHGLTLRHYPQSFEFSTLGGWIATRAGGHFATLWTHIEDLVQSMRAITPAGAWESRRLPGSGAGPSPDRMLAGSEGTLGVITQAWVRVRPRPTHRASAGVHFERFSDGCECVRAISQADLHPAACRLIDSSEARLTMAGDGSSALLVLGFESADHPVQSAMARALEVCEEFSGRVARRTDSNRPDSNDAVGTWREAFLRAPYLRDLLVAMGVLSETFETAITWDRFPVFHERVTAAAREALESVAEPSARGIGQVSCRFTHVYPDGPAPYFTVIAPARRGEEVEQWWAIKRAVSEAIIREGGTITHHHSVGRDHQHWYERQRPELFAAALRGAKLAVDPAGIMNPGVLVGSTG